MKTWNQKYIFAECPCSDHLLSVFLGAWRFCNISEFVLCLIETWEGLHFAAALCSKWIIQSVHQPAFITILAFGAVLEMWEEACRNTLQLIVSFWTVSNVKQWNSETTWYVAFQPVVFFGISTGFHFYTESLFTVAYLSCFNATLLKYCACFCK